MKRVKISLAMKKQKSLKRGNSSKEKLLQRKKSSKKKSMRRSKSLKEKSLRRSKSLKEKSLRRIKMKTILRRMETAVVMKMSPNVKQSLKISLTCKLKRSFMRS